MNNFTLYVLSVAFTLKPSCLLHGEMIVIAGVIRGAFRVQISKHISLSLSLFLPKSRETSSLKNGFSGLIKVLRYSVEFALVRINDVSDTHSHNQFAYAHFNMCLNGLAE